MDLAFVNWGGMCTILVAPVISSPVRLDQPHEALNTVLQLLEEELLLLMLEGLLLHSIDPAGNLLHHPDGLCQQGVVLVLSTGVLQHALHKGVRLQFRARESKIIQRQHQKPNNYQDYLKTFFIFVVSQSQLLL